MDYLTGLRLCKTAEQAENEGNWHDSLQNYIEGLATLLKKYKLDKNKKRKQKMYQHIDNYFNKAEKIKTLLNMETEELMQKLPTIPNQKVKQNRTPIKPLTIQ